MMRFKMMALVAATMLTVPALAQTTDAPVGKPVEKKICRRLEMTGSIIGSATCHTKSEWAQIDARNARDTERTLDASRRVGGNRGDGQ